MIINAKLAAALLVSVACLAGTDSNANATKYKGRRAVVAAGQATTAAPGAAAATTIASVRTKARAGTRVVRRPANADAGFIANRIDTFGLTNPEAYLKDHAYAEWGRASEDVKYPEYTAYYRRSLDLGIFPKSLHHFYADLAGERRFRSR